MTTFRQGRQIVSLENNDRNYSDRCIALAGSQVQLVKSVVTIEINE